MLRPDEAPVQVAPELMRRQLEMCAHGETLPSAHDAHGARGVAGEDGADVGAARAAGEDLGEDIPVVRGDREVPVGRGGGREAGPAAVDAVAADVAAGAECHGSPRWGLREVAARCRPSQPLRTAAGAS